MFEEPKQISITNLSNRFEKMLEVALIDLEISYRTKSFSLVNLVLVLDLAFRFMVEQVKKIPLPVE